MQPNPVIIRKPREMKRPSEEMLSVERFDALRESHARAMKIASVLLLHAQTGSYIEQEEVYDELVELMNVLASGLKAGTEP